MAVPGGAGGQVGGDPIADIGSRAMRPVARQVGERHLIEIEHGASRDRSRRIAPGGAGQIDHRARPSARRAVGPDESEVQPLQRGAGAVGFQRQRCRGDRDCATGDKDGTGAHVCVERAAAKRQRRAERQACFALDRGIDRLQRGECRCRQREGCRRQAGEPDFHAGIATRRAAGTPSRTGVPRCRRASG